MITLCEHEQGLIKRRKGKKNVLFQIGLNRELKDKKLFVTPYKWLTYTTEKLKPLEKKFTRFEL